MTSRSSPETGDAIHSPSGPAMAELSRVTFSSQSCVVSRVGAYLPHQYSGVFRHVRHARCAASVLPPSAGGDAEACRPCSGAHLNLYGRLELNMNLNRHLELETAVVGPSVGEPLALPRSIPDAASAESS